MPKPVVTSTAPRTAWRSPVPRAGARDVATVLHPAGLCFDALGAMAEGFAAIASGDSLPLAPWQRRRYERLLATPDYEVWLIAWAPAGTLDLHDHGGSIGVVRVVEGELIETYTDLARPHPLRSTTLRSEDSTVVPASRVHEVWNPGPLPALSVHVYAPPLTSMTFYDATAGRFLQPLRTQRGDAATIEGHGAS